ncbi:MAG: rhodanese-like domain-containing protein [Chloroflexota bacterium]
MMKRGWLIAAVCLLAVVLAGCAAAPPPGGREVKTGDGVYREITVSQLHEMLAHKDFLLVNVHIPYEGEIANTDLFVPYNEIEQNLARLPQDRGAKIVLYCRSGNMSATAAKTMVRLGYTNVWDVPGGMIAWEQQGYPLLRLPQ